MKPFLLLIILFSSCKSNYDAPCRSPVDYDIPLNTDENATWPYFGIDTLVLIASTGDTLNMILVDVGDAYKEVGIRNNPECPDDILKCQYKFKTYVPDSPFTYFSFRTAISKADSAVSIFFDSSGVSLSFQKLLAPDSATYDSIRFNNRIFNNVYAGIINQTDSIYYTTSQGLIRYRNSKYILNIVRP